MADFFSAHQEIWDTQTRLHRAARLNKVPECEAILRDLGDTDIDAVDAEGNTALALAAHNGRYRIVSMLVEAGADINIENNIGKTPMHLAVTFRSSHRRQNIRCAAFINGSVTTPNKHNVMPLLEVIGNGDHAMLDWIVKEIKLPRAAIELALRYFRDLYTASFLLYTCSYQDDYEGFVHEIRSTPGYPEYALARPPNRGCLEDMSNVLYPCALRAPRVQIPHGMYDQRIVRFVRSLQWTQAKVVWGRAVRRWREWFYVPGGVFEKLACERFY